MESTVTLETDYSVNLDDTLYHYNEDKNFIEELRVLEIHKVRLHTKDEHGFPTGRPRCIEMVFCTSGLDEKLNRLIPLSEVWRTPEEAMSDFSRKKLKAYKRN